MGEPLKFPQRVVQPSTEANDLIEAMKANPEGGSYMPGPETYTTAELLAAERKGWENGAKKVREANAALAESCWSDVASVGICNVVAEAIRSTPIPEFEEEE